LLSHVSVIYVCFAGLTNTYGYYSYYTSPRECCIIIIIIFIFIFIMNCCGDWTFELQLVMTNSSLLVLFKDGLADGLAFWQ